MYAQSPPTWLIFAVIFALALPMSAIVGLGGWWLWRHFLEHE